MFTHCVRLFDTSASLGRHVSSYVAAGLDGGEGVLVVIRPENWIVTADRLAEHSVDVPAVVAAGQLTVIDAHELLARIAPQGRLDSRAFATSAGRCITDLASQWSRLRVYGEMVDILAGAGDFAGAEQLEGFWTDLSREVAFSLLCGYWAIHFGGDRSDAALERICAAHAAADADPVDSLSRWLVNRSATQDQMRH